MCSNLANCPVGIATRGQSLLVWVDQGQYYRSSGQIKFQGIPTGSFAIFWAWRSGDRWNWWIVLASLELRKGRSGSTRKKREKKGKLFSHKKSLFGDWRLGSSRKKKSGIPDVWSRHLFLHCHWWPGLRQITRPDISPFFFEAKFPDPLFYASFGFAIVNFPTDLFQTFKASRSWTTWIWICIWIYSKSQDRLPDEPFHNFGASKSVARRSRTTYNMPVSWSLGSKIVKGLVGRGA